MILMRGTAPKGTILVSKGLHPTYRSRAGHPRGPRGQVNRRRWVRVCMTKTRGDQDFPRTIGDYENSPTQRGFATKKLPRTPRRVVTSL